jgi:hypothetical protein
MKRHQKLAAVGLLTVACSHQPPKDAGIMTKEQAQEVADRQTRIAREHGQCGTAEVVQAGGNQWHEVWTPKGCPKQELDALNGKMTLEFNQPQTQAHKKVHTIER